MRGFAQVVRSGNLSSAADVLHITQPAVTQQIKALENHFGVQLLERNRKGVETTAAGQVVFSYANRLLDLVECLEQDVQAMCSAIGGELIVGATSTVGGYAVPCSVCIFRERYPEARFKLRVGNRRQVLDWLRRGEVHVALIEGNTFGGPFVKRAIAHDQLALIVPIDGDPLGGRPVIAARELAGLPFIMREPGSGTREVIERALPPGMSVNDLNVILELDNVDSIKAAVEAGRGVSVISKMAIRKELRTRTLRTAEVEGTDFEQRIYLAWLRDRIQTKLEELFVGFLRSPHRGFC